MVEQVEHPLKRILIQNLRTEQLLGMSFVPVPMGLFKDLQHPPQSDPAKSREEPSPSATRPSPHPAPAAARVAVTAPPADAPWRQPGTDLDGKRLQLAQLDNGQVKGCQRCGLAGTRTNTVFGQGNPAARLVFVGEAPGADEDAQGLAFVGRAGQLLTQMIGAMKLSRDDVFICNVLKCRPPNNREPAPEEIRACSPYLMEQLRIIKPEVIVALGSPAAKTLLDTDESIGRLRGRFHNFYLSGFAGQGDPIPLMPTYHPAYLLRNQNEKPKAWSDLKLVMEKLGIPVPA